MKMKRWAACALALAMMAASLGSCGPQTIAANETTAAQSAASTAAEGSSTGSGSTENLLDPNNPVTVTFYSYSLGYPTMKAGMEHLINSFNETIGKEKGVVVEGVVDDMTKFKTDIQAGNQVDIIQHPFGTLDASRQSLGIQAYEDVFPADELAEHLEGISENAQALGKINGKMYALAFTFSTPILYINEKLFTDAGLDPSNPPTTWEETLEAAQIIKEKTGKDGFGMAPNNGWVTEGLVFSNGSDMVSEDGNQAVFANDQTVEAFELWKEFYTTGCAAKGTDSDVMQQFMAGNLAMNLQSTSMLSGYANAAEEGGWTLSGAPMPSFGDKEAVPVSRRPRLSGSLSNMPPAMRAIPSSPLRSVICLCGPTWRTIPIT